MISHGSQCGCGHQHLPNQAQLEQATSLRSKLLVVMSISMRPCSGAIFILFLSYMSNLYLWGVLATLAMSMGTGLMLSAFGLMVLYARNKAIKCSQWYLSPYLKPSASHFIKLFVGLLLVLCSVAMIYGTTLPVRGGAVLFGSAGF